MKNEENLQGSEKALRTGIVSKRYYLTKDRQGNYQLLNELAYEKKLIYG